MTLPVGGPPVKPPRRGCLIAAIIAAGVFVMLLVIAATAVWFVGRRVTSGLSDVGEAIVADAGVDPAAPGAGKGVHLVEVGTSVDLSGLSAEVAGFERVDDRVVVHVRLRNVIGRDRQYSGAEFRLQSPSRAIVLPSDVDRSAFVTLAAGQAIDLDLSYLVGAPGRHYLIWRPSTLSLDRAVLAARPVTLAVAVADRVAASARTTAFDEPFRPHQRPGSVGQEARSLVHVASSDSGSTRVSATEVMKLVSPFHRGSTCTWQ